MNKIRIKLKIHVAYTTTKKIPKAHEWGDKFTFDTELTFNPPPPPPCDLVSLTLKFGASKYPLSCASPPAEKCSITQLHYSLTVTLLSYA